jgi:hypothetical protein
VHRDRPGERQVACLVAIVGHLAAWERNPQRAGATVEVDDRADVAVGDLELGIVAGLHHAVADVEAGDVHGPGGRVEALLQRHVERVDAGGPTVDRRDDLDVVRTDAEVRRRTAGDRLHDARDDGLAAWLLRQEHVAVDAGEVPDLAGVDLVGERHDPARRGLAVHLGEGRGRDHLRPQQVAQHVAGPHRRQLVRVADEQQVGAVVDGGHEP